MSYLRGLGFDVVTVNENDLAAFRAQYGIPDELSSCHTAIVEDSGYFIEGHVPVTAIDKLLEERPEVSGIALPGMPVGSPGMDGEPEAQLEIYALRNGKVELFVRLNRVREG